MADRKDIPVAPTQAFQFWRYRLAAVVRAHNRIARLAGDDGVVSLDEFIAVAERQSAISPPAPQRS